MEAYHTKHRQMKMLEKELKALREEIEPYMQDKNLASILGEDGRGVALENRRMPLLTAQFTTYDIDDLVMVLDLDVVSECIVEVVDRNLVEAMVNLGKVPKEIEELKKFSLKPHFVAK
ncbi:hypothetical protein D3C80_1843350 [compost metagenome]